MLPADFVTWEADPDGGRLPTAPLLEAHALLLAAQLLQLVRGRGAGGHVLVESDAVDEEVEEWLTETWGWLERPAGAGAGRRRVAAAGGWPSARELRAPGWGAC